MSKTGCKRSQRSPALLLWSQAAAQVGVPSRVLTRVLMQTPPTDLHPSLTLLRYPRAFILPCPASLIPW